MKVYSIILIIAFTALLTGCADTTPFYANAEKIAAQRKLIEEKFGKDVKLGNLSLVYDKSSGNFITVEVRTSPQAKVVNWWTYSKIPRAARRRGIKFFEFAIGGWSEVRENLYKPGNQKFFGLDELMWDKIPGLCITVLQDLEKKGIPEPELKFVSFSNYNNELTATIEASTRGGGSSISYIFNMKGQLVNEPEI